jgi:hypothetical protein
VSILEECPHCRERTEIEVPTEGYEGETTVEYQQDCDYCARSIVAVFKVEFVLQEMRAA